MILHLRWYYHNTTFTGNEAIECLLLASVQCMSWGTQQQEDWHKELPKLPAMSWWHCVSWEVIPGFHCEFSPRAERQNLGWKSLGQKSWDRNPGYEVWLWVHVHNIHAQPATFTQTWGMLRIQYCVHLLTFWQTPASVWVQSHLLSLSTPRTLKTEGEWTEVNPQGIKSGHNIHWAYAAS